MSPTPYPTPRTRWHPLAMAPALVLVLAILTGCGDGQSQFFDGGPPPGGEAGTRDARARDTLRRDAGPPPPSIRVHAIDVGAGLCVLVEMPDPKKPVLLADCGQDVWKGAGVSGTTAANYARQVIGKRKVVLIVSHPHSDHYSLVDNVLDKGGPPLELDSVWLGGKLDDYTADGKRFLNRISAFRSQQPKRLHDNLPRSYFSPYPQGEPELTFGHVKTYVVAVNESVGKPGNDTNGKSMVAVVKYGWFMAVLPGDADGDVQVLAANNAKTAGLPLSQAALLMASHHGSGTKGSNDQAWADAVRPQAVIYSSGRDVDAPQTKMHNDHPYHTVVSRYEGLKSLRGAVKHGLYQGLYDKKANKRDTRKAHYGTAANGVVIVSSTGQPGNLRVACKALPGTTRDTACAIK